MNLKITDKQIVEGVQAYRGQVDGLSGPGSLDEFGNFLAWHDPEIKEPVAKATLSPRLQALIERGLLGVRGAVPWMDDNDNRLFTAGLHVTPGGLKYLEGNGDEHETDWQKN